MKDFSGYIADLLNDGIPALIYAGDVDFICNYLGNRAWTLALDWDHAEEFNAAEEHEWQDKGGDAAGLARTANGLTFLQVRGLIQPCLSLGSLTRCAATPALQFLTRSSTHLTLSSSSTLQVYDAGHMVPSDQPKVALDMIANFLQGGDF